MNCKQQKCLKGTVKRTDCQESVYSCPFWRILTKVLAICKLHFLSDNQEKIAVINVVTPSQFPLSASSVNSCQYVTETNLKTPNR